MAREWLLDGNDMSVMCITLYCFISDEDWFRESSLDGKFLGQFAYSKTCDKHFDSARLIAPTHVHEPYLDNDSKPCRSLVRV